MKNLDVKSFVSLAKNPEEINDLIDEKLGKKSEDNEMLDEISKVPEESFKEPNE